MAKSEIIVLVMNEDNLRGVRYVPKGSSGLVRAGGGVWPFAETHAGDDTDLPEVTPEEEESPLSKAVKAARRELGGGDVVVAFPMSKLLLRILKMPVAMREDLADAVALQMDKISPFNDGEYSVGYEVMSEDEESLWVLSAAMANTTFTEINEPLQRAGWRVVRSDIALLGWLRTLCGPLKLNTPGRRIVLTRFKDDWAVLVMNHGTLVLARTFGNSGSEALVRELTLSMLNVEMEAGPLSVVEILVLAEERPDENLFRMLNDLFGVSAEYKPFPSLEGGVEGVALRSSEQNVIDLTPQYWHTEMQESSVRKKVMAAVITACALWVVFMAVIFAGPAVYKHLSKTEKKKSAEHSRAFLSVSDTRDRVNLILSYTDRKYSPLEMLRVTSGYLPQGITLTGFNYKRQDGVKITGEADLPTLVYQFKNALTEDDLFESVSLVGPSASKGKHKFDVHAVFKGSEKE